jgi:hypothetical protein
LAGIDALYLSLTRAEQFGSQPIPPHTVAVLRTSPVHREEGFPPFIITGYLLNQGEPDTADAVLPRIVASIVGAIDDVNAREPGAIRTLGLFEYELSFKDRTLTDSARLLAASLEADRHLDPPTQ